MVLWAQSYCEAKNQEMKAETPQAYIARKKCDCLCWSLTLCWRYTRQAVTTQRSGET